MRASPARHKPRLAALLAASVALALLGGCGTTRLVATANIPPPLVQKVPVTVALHVPKEFSEFVHKEKRWSTDWAMELGKAQSEALTGLVQAMFERVVLVDSINAGAALGSDVRAILEPSVEEYAFVTPRDAGSPFYAVSVKYRMNVYSPDGRLADSWGFTGYGTSPSQGLSSTAPLTRATSLAMRDAGAKLAVEFREQAIVRGLMPGSEPQSPGTANPPADPSASPPPAGAAPAAGTAAPPAKAAGTSTDKVPAAPKAAEAPNKNSTQPEAGETGPKSAEAPTPTTSKAATGEAPKPFKKTPSAGLKSIR